MWNKHKAAVPDDPHAAQIEERLAKLEQLLLRLSEQKPETHIRIERLHIQEAVLESMTVRLDSLDIEEISGSLNIGNNFHTLKGEAGLAKQAEMKANGKSDKLSTPSSAASSTRHESGVHRTPTGYSIRFDHAEGGG